MATALSIVQKACDIVGMPSPQSLLSTTDQQAKSLKTMFMAALETLNNRNWPVAEREGTITVLSDTATYSLPSDFQRIVTDSAFDTSDYYRLRGNVTAPEFQSILTQGSPSWVKRFRIAYSGGLKFRFAPTPDAGSTVTYIYITKNVLTDADGLEISEIASDTDMPIFDPYLVQLELVWRYKKSRGFDYGEEYRESTLTADTRYAQAINSGIITPFSDNVGDPITDGYVRERNFGV
jgi:hypothetical protein